MPEAESVEIRLNRSRRYSALPTARINHALVAVSLCFALASCASSTDPKHPVYRDLRIVNGHFSRESIEVPASTPMVIEIGLEGLIDASVQSPALGIEPTPVPPNAVESGKFRGPGPGYFKTARILVGPLPVGRYELICKCGGHEDVAVFYIR